MAALLWVVALEALWLRAWLVLRGRGVALPAWQVACWHAGVLLWVLALAGPPGRLAEESLTAHMAEHLLLADLGAPLLVAGMRNPLLAFLLPRPLLVSVARRPRLRGFLRRIRRPLPAIAIFALALYGWHIGAAFEAAVENPFAHALQHASFVGSGILVWWAALEPKRRRMRGELWKIGHILGARMVSMMIGMAFILIREPVYTGVYGSGERRFGLSALGDQQTAGGLMVSVDILLMAFALTFFFWRASADAER